MDLRVMVLLKELTCLQITFPKFLFYWIHSALGASEPDPSSWHVLSRSRLHPQVCMFLHAMSLGESDFPWPLSGHRQAVPLNAPNAGICFLGELLLLHVKQVEHETQYMMEVPFRL